MHTSRQKNNKSLTNNTPDTQPIQRMVTITIHADKIVNAAAVAYAPKSKITDNRRDMYTKYRMNTSNLPTKKLDQLLSYEKLKKSNLKIEDDEDINIIAHGTNPHIGDNPILGGENPENLADMFSAKLPKSYRGTIWLNGCNTAIRGKNNKPSFIELFVEGMKTKGFQNITVKANFGDASTNARRDSAKEHIYITDPMIANLYLREGELLQTQDGSSYVESPNGVLKYQNGIYMMSGIQREVVDYHKFTIKPDPETLKPRTTTITRQVLPTVENKPGLFARIKKKFNSSPPSKPSNTTPDFDENVSSLSEQYDDWDGFINKELGYTSNNKNINIEMTNAEKQHLERYKEAERKQKKRFSFW